MENKQIYKTFNKSNDRPVTNNVYLCACICMIIPILNLIFGWIGITKKYPKDREGFRKQRTICSAAFWVGLVEVVGGLIALVTLLIMGYLGVEFNGNVQSSLVINFSIFGAVVIASAIFLWKVKLAGQGYKLLFVMYTIFWIPLMLLRENSGVFQNSIDASYAWIALGAYGAVGIIIRPIADVMSWGTKSRKTFIYFSLGLQILTYIPAVIIPCTATSVIQSLAVGVGASAIGTYQLLFSEQYGKSKTFLTVSVLSIPPLLADFISSPLTNVFRTIAYIPETDPAKYNSDILKWMWLVGLGFAIVALVMAFFLKENRNNIAVGDENKTQIHGQQLIWYFILLLLLGSLIGFIKFACSGTATVSHIEILERIAFGEDQSADIYVGYLSVIFSVAQLIGGLLVGLVLVKYMNKLAIFAIGAGLWGIYAIASMFAINPYGYLAIHFINGLAFGILYNFVLAFALGLCFKTKWITPMGVYQAVLSIGVMFGTSISNWLRFTMSTETSVEYQENVLYLIYGVVAAMIFLSFMIYTIMFLLEKLYYKDHPDKAPKKSSYNVEFKKNDEKLVKTTKNIPTN